MSHVMMKLRSCYILQPPTPTKYHFARSSPIGIGTTLT